MKQRMLRGIATLLGGLGYFSNILQWAWAGGIYLPALLNSKAGEWLMPEVEPVSNTAQSTMSLPGPIGMIFVGIVVIVIMVAMAVVMVRIPKQIVRVGHLATQKAAGQLMPIVTHKKPLPAKKRRALTARLVLSIKVVMTILPLVTLLIPRPQLELSDALVLFVGAYLATWTLVFFLLQIVAAHVGGTREDKIV